MYARELVSHNFEHVAGVLMSSLGGITNLQLAPCGIVGQIYPLSGNEATIGHNLLQGPDRIQQADGGGFLLHLDPGREAGRRRWRPQSGTFGLKIAAVIVSNVGGGISTVATYVANKALAHTNKAIAEEETKVHSRRG